MASMPGRQRIGRRMFGKTLATAATTLVSTEAPAQAPPQTDSQLQSARQDLRQSARAIGQVPLPRTVEPAFRFKP